MSLVPDSQQDVLQARLAGIAAEYDIRRESVDNQFYLKKEGERFSVDLTRSRTATDIELAAAKNSIDVGIAQLKNAASISTDAIKNAGEIEINNIGNTAQVQIAGKEAVVQLELADIKGRMQVDLAELGAELGLERAAIIGEASVIGKTAIANSKADARYELEVIEGNFKRELAKLTGESKIKMAGLEVQSKDAISTIKQASTRSLADLEAHKVGEETVEKIRQINLKKGVDLGYQAGAAFIEISGINIASGTDVGNIYSDADQEAWQIRQDSIAVRGFLDIESGAEIAAIKADSGSDIGKVNSRVSQETAYINKQVIAEGLADIAIATQQAIDKAAMNAIRVGSIWTDNANDIAAIALENSVKLAHINSMKVLRMGLKTQETNVDLFILGEEARIKTDTAGDLLDIKLRGADAVTLARTGYIATREADKVRNEKAVILEENRVMKEAAETVATNTDINAQQRVSELQTLSLNDYLAALRRADLQAEQTKGLADQDAGQAELDARDDVTISRETFDIVSGYERTVGLFKEAADLFLATAHKTTTTTRYVNTSESDGPNSGGDSAGSPPQWNIFPPRLLEAP